MKEDDEQFTITLGIYILPTVRGIPPRAVLTTVSPEELVRSRSVPGMMAIWTADQGSWMVEGEAIPEEISNAITAQAKSLGVKW
ncbi:MAG: hypothetical protein ABSG43_21330 [Solirubrobacteraceae bacterium]